MANSGREANSEAWLRVIPRLADHPNVLLGEKWNGEATGYPKSTYHCSWGNLSETRAGLLSVGMHPHKCTTFILKSR